MHALDFNAPRKFHDASHSFILHVDRAHRFGLLASVIHYKLACAMRLIGIILLLHCCS